MLDNAIDITRWPLIEHMREAHAKRRIGVGVTGLADALTMMGLPYQAPEARNLAVQIGRCLRDNAYAASAALAQERSPYPLFRAERSLAPGHFVATLPGAVRETIARHGLRNSHLLSLAPTGSVSLAFGGNCSSGIEPAFDWAYQRRVRIHHGQPQLYRIENHAYRCFQAMHGEHAVLPSYFVTANQVDGDDHLKMVAALQPFIDASISKTILISGGVSPAQVGALLFERGNCGSKASRSSGRIPHRMRCFPCCRLPMAGRYASAECATPLFANAFHDCSPATFLPPPEMGFHTRAEVEHLPSEIV